MPDTLTNTAKSQDAEKAQERLFESDTLQAKLKIGKPSDSYEANK
jgi:hypothetical protein